MIVFGDTGLSPEDDRLAVIVNVPRDRRQGLLEYRNVLVCVAGFLS